MSINDVVDGIANDPTFITDVFGIILVCILIVIPIGIIMDKKTNKSLYGDSSGPIQSEHARVIGKRQSPHPLNQKVMVNMIVFEFDSGERREFGIKNASDYAMIAEGDKGTLHYSGNSFIRFIREI